MTSRVRLSLIIVLICALFALLVPTPAALASGNLTTVGPFTWNAQYFNNATLSGGPIITRLDQGINFNWGLGSPGLGIPSDNFSARWTTTANLAAGTYKFTILADDGARLYVDGTVQINTFDVPKPGTPLVAQVAVGAGNHALQLEYRELTSTAYVYLTIEQVAAVSPTPTPVPTGPAVGYVNTTGLNVHAGPDYSYAVVVVLFKDGKVTLLGRNQATTWLNVKTEAGQVGWVEVSHITTSYPVGALTVTDGTVTPKPPSTPAPTTPKPQPGTTRQHIVKPGETLYRIAIYYGVDMYELARINGITNLNLIFVGQVLIIPA